MAKLRHWIEYVAIVCLWWLAATLPSAFVDWFGRMLGGLAYQLIPSRRKIAMENLRNAFKGERNDPELAEICKQVFVNLGRTTLETARYSGYDDETTHLLVDAAGTEAAREKLFRIVSEGNGGIVVTAHFGNWELLASWIASQKIGIDFLATEQRNPHADEIITRMRTEKRGGYLQIIKEPRQLVQSMKAHRLLGLATDQHAAGNSLIFDFLGRPASVARGAALLATRGNCPILPLLIRRKSRDQHTFLVGELLYPSSFAEEGEERILAMTKRYTAFFEQAIRSYPDQWMWTHRRWKLPNERQLKPEGIPDVELQMRVSNWENEGGRVRIGMN